MKTKNFIILSVVMMALSLLSCEHPHNPAINNMLIYAPNTTFEVEYYTNDGTGNHSSRTISVSPTDEEPTYTIASLCGHYYPEDLKNHPEWGSFSIKRTEGSSPIYGTPFPFVYVNGNAEPVFSNENGWLQKKLEILVEQKYMFKVDDDEQHTFPISSLWHETMAYPEEGEYPSITIE